MWVHGRLGWNAMTFIILHAAEWLVGLFIVCGISAVIFYVLFILPSYLRIWGGILWRNLRS